MKQKEIKVLMVEPGKHPKVTTITNDLDSLQKAVSIGADYQGLIEFVSLGNGDCIMCNEEGKLFGMDGNRRLGNNILVGVFYIMSENEDGELLSLSEKKIKRYIQNCFGSLRPLIVRILKIRLSVTFSKTAKKEYPWVFFF